MIACAIIMALIACWVVHLLQGSVPLSARVAGAIHALVVACAAAVIIRYGLDPGQLSERPPTPLKVGGRDLI